MLLSPCLLGSLGFLAIVDVATSTSKPLVCNTSWRRQYDGHGRASNSALCGHDQDKVQSCYVNTCRFARPDGEASVPLKDMKFYRCHRVTSGKAGTKAEPVTNIWSYWGKKDMDQEGFYQEYEVHDKVATWQCLYTDKVVQCDSCYIPRL